MTRWRSLVICSNCGYSIGQETKPKVTIIVRPNDGSSVGILPLEIGPGGEIISMGILNSPEEISNMEHNQWRYHELQKLRRGMPNRYNETRYRN